MARTLKSLLDINDLDEVKTLLVTCHFEKTKYYELGLKLGLLAPTLNAIRADNVNNVTGCLLECLSAWLRKVDNVKSKGDPTYETLIAALRAIEENAVADGIHGQMHPACVILARHQSDQSLQDSLPSLVLLLYKEGITKEILPVTGGTEALLAAVQEAVCLNYEKLEKFAAILQLFPATVSAGNAILEDYKIYIPKGLSLNFITIRTEFASTVDKVNEILKASVEIQRLKEYLHNAIPHLRNQLRQCQSVEAILKLITERSSPINIRYLEGIVDHFDVENAKPHILKYKETVHDFCKTISLRLSLNKVFSAPSSLKCETATFVVDQDVDESTLNDVKDLLALAFEILSLHVRVVVIRDSNSFTVTCSFPLVLSESLIASAIKNLQSLKEKGLLQLTIGYSTVYSTIHDVVKEIGKGEETCLMESTVLSEQEWITAAYTSRGTLEQLVVSQTVQLVNREFELKEELGILNEKLSKEQMARKRAEKEMMTYQAKLKKEMVSLQEKQKDMKDHQLVIMEEELASLNEKMIAERLARKSESEKEVMRLQEETELLTEQLALFISEKDEHDTGSDTADLLRQPAVQEKENEIECLKTSLAEKEKEIETLHSIKEMREKVSVTQEMLIRQKTREIESLKITLSKLKERFDDGNDSRHKQIPSDFDQLLQSVGVFCEATNNLIPDDISYKIANAVSHQSLKDIISNPEFKIKVRRVLVLFTGLPKSGKSKAFNSFVSQHVRSNPLLPLQMESRPVAPNDISHYDLVAAADSESLQSLQLTKATKESSCIFGILSAFLQLLLETKVVPVLLDSKDDAKCFENNKLNEHIHHIYQYLQSGFPNELMSIPDEYALVNMWDVPSNNIIHHILLQLQGHLTKNYLCQFLNLDRDLQNLQKPPEMETGGDRSIIMRWRPRLHYLLRSCRLSDSQAKKRRNVVTIFAEYYESISNQAGIKRKVKELEDKVQTAAVHTGVSELLNDRIEAIDVQGNLHTLSQNIKEAVFKFQVEAIPIAWLFLRSCLHYSKERFITKDALETMAEECGMDQQSTTDFCKFYMSFGSIFDLSLVDSRSQYVIVKPIHFLRSLRDFLCPAGDELDRRFPTIRLGIVPERAGRIVFIDDWPAYKDALVCLKLATEVEIKQLELSVGSNIDPNSKCYYTPLSHTGPLMADPDPHSIHLITSINTPDVFKEVALVEKLLKLLPKSKLVPCSNSNQIVIKDDSTGTTVTFVSYGPAVKIHLDRPNGAVCEAIVQIYDEIARRSPVTVKYKFVKMCVEADIPNARYLPSADYHILPTDEGNGLCDECEEASRDDELLKVWNKALHKYPIQYSSKPSGQLKEEEKTSIADKIASLNIDVIAETFGFSNYREQPELSGMSGSHLINEFITQWERKIQRTKGAQEPRRAFARKITELWENFLCHGEVPKGWMRKVFVELANSVDMYYIVDNI